MANPHRWALDDDIRKLRSETRAVKEKIGEMVEVLNSVSGKGTK